MTKIREYFCYAKSAEITLDYTIIRIKVFHILVMMLLERSYMYKSERIPTTLYTYVGLQFDTLLFSFVQKEINRKGKLYKI